VTLVLPSGLELARLDGLPDPGAIVVRVNVDDLWGAVILTRRGETISAFRNKCPHAGYPLQRGDGRVVVQEGRFIVCAAHGASYVLDSGACAGGPCNGDALERIAVTVRDGAVYAV
jgi:nitrite reductase/ring-hydroxylating ferredoxin subunit